MQARKSRLSSHHVRKSGSIPISHAFISQIHSLWPQRHCDVTYVDTSHGKKCITKPLYVSKKQNIDFLKTRANSKKRMLFSDSTAQNYQKPLKYPFFVQVNELGHWSKFVWMHSPQQQRRLMFRFPTSIYIFNAASACKNEIFTSLASRPQRTGMT